MLSVVLVASQGWQPAHGHVTRGQLARPRMSLGSLPLGMSDKEFQRVAKRVPTIAECLQGAQARDGWPSLCALQTRLTITDAELKAAVLRLPQLLLVEDYASEVAPGLEAVQRRLALSDEQLKGVVLKLPQLLGLDYDSEVAPKLDALQQRLGCDDAALAAEVLRNPNPNLTRTQTLTRCPQALALTAHPRRTPTLTRCCATLRPRPSRCGMFTLTPTPTLALTLTQTQTQTQTPCVHGHQGARCAQEAQCAWRSDDIVRGAARC